jgi:hypothetical protein
MRTWSERAHRGEPREARRHENDSSTAAVDLGTGEVREAS